MNSPAEASRASEYHPVAVTLEVGLSTGVTMVSAVSDLQTIAVMVRTSGGGGPGVRVVPTASGLSTARYSSIDVRFGPSAATTLAVGRTEAAHRVVVEVDSGRAGVGCGPYNSGSRRPDRCRRRPGIWSFS